MIQEQNLEKKVTREEILREIEDAKKRYETEDAFWAGYFNNFFGKLPEGWYRKMFADNLNEGTGNLNASEIRKCQTLEQFLSTIDEIIEQERISVEKITYLNRLYSNHTIQQRAELHRLAFPVYIRLREMGYSRYPDLFG